MTTDSPPPKPVKRRGAPVVERVLEVALAELAQVGYQRFSVPDVAARAGLNKTSVYRRWPTKAALIGAALERALGHDAPPPDTGSLRSDMLVFTLAAAAWASSPVGRGVLAMLQAEVEDAEIRALLSTLIRKRDSAPLAMFQRARARGELAPDADVRMTLRIIAGTINHRLLVEDAPLTPAFVRRLVTLVCDGLLTTH